MFGIFADLLSSIITILFPVFASYKALRSADPSQLAPWLMYWVVLSAVLLAESWTVFIIGWFPFYSWIRLFFMSYLVLPQTQGARLLYQDYVDPFLAHHEHEIEELIGRSHERAKALGLQYFYQAIDLIRTKVLGLPPQPVAPPPPAGPAGFVQNLYSRYTSPPGAASSGPADWASVLNSTWGMFTSADKSSGSHERGMREKFQSMPESEKAQFKQYLDSLQSGLFSEGARASRAEPDTDDLAYGAPLRKNKSDNSFDVVDDEDLGSRAVRRASGKYTSGWFGTASEQDSSGSSDYASRSTGYDRYN